MPRSPGAVVVLIAVTCLGAWTGRCGAQPPVRYNGELRLSGRAIVPDQGDETYLFGRTGRVNLDSFIWQPWFMSVGGGLDLSWVDTFASSDTETQVLGGDARVTLFPQSRFPTLGFVSVSDTRADVEASEIPERQVRITRFGFAQTYQPIDGGSHFAVRADRSIEDGTDDHQRAVIDRADLNGSFVTQRQQFSANLNVKDSSRDFNDERLRELVGTVRHNARPTETTTVDSFVTYTDTSSDSALIDFANRTFQANSVALWRPLRVPLTVSGAARLTASQIERDSVGDETTNGNLAFGADYLVNRLTRLSGNVNLNYTDENVSSNQGATLSFNPDPIGLGSYTYNWFTSTSVANEVGTPTGDRTIFGAQFNHGVTRARPFARAPSWIVSVAGNNTLSGSFDTIEGAAATIGVNGSIGLSHGSAGGITTVRLDASDTRSFGATRNLPSGSTSFQSVGFNLGHRQDLSADSSWSANVAMGWSRQDFAGSDNTTAFSSANVGYNNSRLFGVRRMVFRSQLTARTTELFFAELSGGEDTDIRWENRLDYTIGRLEVRLSGTVSRINVRNTYTVLLTIARKFDGIF